MAGDEEGISGVTFGNDPVIFFTGVSGGVDDGVGGHFGNAPDGVLPGTVEGSVCAAGDFATMGFGTDCSGVTVGFGVAVGGGGNFDGGGGVDFEGAGVCDAN